MVEPLQVKEPRHVVDKVPARKELVGPNLLGDVVLGVGEDLDADGDEGLVSRDVPLGGQHLKLQHVMILHLQVSELQIVQRHLATEQRKVRRLLSEELKMTKDLELQVGHGGVLVNEVDFALDIEVRGGEFNGDEDVVPLTVVTAVGTAVVSVIISVVVVIVSIITSGT